MYKIIEPGLIHCLQDNTFIPADPANTDFQRYQSWLAAGNTPQPADPPPAPDHAALRRAAYAAESDPLFFMAQRGEVTQQEWIDKVAEIRARFPTP
jgi:hypothetical protein